MEGSRIATGRARATIAKRALAVGSVAALGTTFLLVRAHVTGATASRDDGGSHVSRSFDGSDEESQDLGGGALSPAPLDVQPQVQSGTS